MSGWSLAALLAPLPLETFWAEHFERAPLYQPAQDPTRFAGLLDTATIERLLEGPALVHDECRMARDGERLTRDDLGAAWVARARRTRDDAEVDMAKVRAAHAAGATLILDALHRRHPPLGAFIRDLEGELTHPVQVNVYRSPANAQGFGQHYDTHDVFILHLEGRKRWQIYDQPVPLPLSQGKDTAALQAKRQVVMELELTPGDLLYLPRGHLHQTRSVGGPSLHLTVGLLLRKWLRALDVARELAEEHLVLRHAMPPGYVHDREGFAAGWQAALEALAQVPVDRLHERLAHRFVRARRPLPRAPAPAVDITADTQLRKRPGLVWRLAPRGDEVRLEWLERRLDLPAYTAPSLRHLLAGPPARAGALDGTLDEAGCLVLAKRLYREGLLEPA